MNFTLEQHKIQDTKTNYSRIHKTALNGVPVLTFSGHNKNIDKAVVHIGYKYYEKLLDNLPVTSSTTFDAETSSYSAVVEELPNIYGEGSTSIEAIDDWTEAALTLETMYSENIEKYSVLWDDDLKLYMFKIISCKGDSSVLKEVFGFGDSILTEGYKEASQTL